MTRLARPQPGRAHQLPPGYYLGSGLAALVSRLLADWRVEGAEAVPRTGPLIVATNHFSFVDPPLLSASFPRPLRFFAKAELWDSLPSRLFCDAIGAIPVRRGEADRAALRAALVVLESGGAVAFFPEGTRGRDHPRTLKPARPGVAFLARRSGAPVVPVGIAGTDVVETPQDIAAHTFKRPPFRVRIGEPVWPDTKDLEAGTETVMRAIAALLPDRYRGPYAEAIVKA